MHKSGLPHLQALIHVLRYIAHTSGQGILLQATNTLILQAYSDSDWDLVPTPGDLSRAMYCY